jgi:hypothetical protein
LKRFDMNSAAGLSSKLSSRPEAEERSKPPEKVWMRGM